jgi:predicted PurR-regulated permease PerM
MTIKINLAIVAYFILFILGSTALVFLIIFLSRLANLIARIDKVFEKNENNLNAVFDTLPQASDNLTQISENLKDVSDVVTSATASVITTKESIDDYLDFGKDIYGIIKKVFSK